jgi:hypothetical protein
MKRYAPPLALIIALVAAPCFAQTAPSAIASAAATPVWEFHLDLSKLYASPLGKLVMDIAKVEEPDLEQKLDELTEAIGFDPRTTVGHVAVFGNSFDDSDVTTIVSLGDNRGNIEGWVLAAPGYESEQLDNDTLLHSFNTSKGGVRMWCALPRSKTDNRFVLVASVDREKTVSLTNEVLAEGLLAILPQLADQTLVSVRVNDLTALNKVLKKLDKDQPGAALVRTIRSIDVDLSSVSDTLSAHCTLETDTPARAQQISQLLTGLKAMLQLAAPQDDPDVQQALKLAEKLSVEYNEGETRVSTEFLIDYDELDELVRKNM